MMSASRHIFRGLCGYHNSMTKKFIVIPQQGAASLCRSSMCTTPMANGLLMPCRTMAGHSHWANIKHGKARDDSRKSAVYSLFTKKIRAATRNGKGTNPKYNPDLLAVIEASKKSMVPSHVIDRALKRLEESKNLDGADDLLELSLLNGTKLLIHYDPSIMSIKGKITNVFKKFGPKQEKKGNIVNNHFETRGVVCIQLAKEEGSDISKLMEKYTDIAIETGAEDVEIVEDEEEGIIVEFTCASDDLAKVTSNLEAMNFEPVLSEVEYKPYSYLELNPEEKTRLEATCQRIINDEMGEYCVSAIKSNVKDWEL